MKMEFYRCEHCGNIVAIIENSGVPVECCSDDMELLTANTTDGAEEKHVPVCKLEGSILRVRVGESEHPMEVEHYIQWIAIQTSCGWQIKWLKAGEKPEACFALCEGEKVEAVCEYCNIHGLWASTEIA